MSWLVSTPEQALAGIRQLVGDVVAGLVACAETVPEPLADKHFSGRFLVRVPSPVHRARAIEAAEQGVSLNRLVSSKLA